MTEGFDNEIDAILRKARDGEFAFGNNSQNHLDADEISAFAENALPEKSKSVYTKHLADCDRCRRILSNIISLNSEAETVPAFAASKEVQAAPAVPWYRRLFAFPGLAYSLGALVLVFGGLIGFIALQSSNLEVSQMSNKPMESKSAPQNAANNTATASNATAPTNSANTNSVSVYSSNSSNSVSSNQAANTPAADSSVRQDNLVTERKEETAKTTDESIVPQAQPTVQGEDRNKDAEVTTRSLPNPAKKVERDADTKTDKNSTPRETQKPNLAGSSSDATGETRNVNGKTFNHRNNVWVDSEYKNQPTIKITRGTNEYKKLDKDLRQTVERLGGIVVILWKNQAYRIQ